MDNSYQRPRLQVPMTIRLRRIFGMALAVAVLLAVSGILVWLFDRERAVRFCGVVDSGAENIGPVETARIATVFVVPGQSVKEGDPIVSFDPAARLMDEAMSEMKIRDSETELICEERRCRQLVCEAEVELELKRMEQLREAAELAGYETEINRIEPLVEKKIVSELELSALRPKAESLRRIVGAYGPLLASLSNRLESARRDAEAVVKQVTARLEGDLRVADEALFTAFKRDASILHAMSDGVVSQVFRRSGDIVPAGEPVVRLAASPDKRLVTGMLPADRLDAVSVGDEVRVARMATAMSSSADAEVVGIVEAIDLEVLDFFDPNNPAPHTPARGRKVHIRLAGDTSHFIPGESVLVTAAAGGGQALRGILNLFSGR